MSVRLKESVRKLLFTLVARHKLSILFNNPAVTADVKNVLKLMRLQLGLRTVNLSF